MRIAVALLLFTEGAMACRCKMLSAAQAYPRAAAVALASVASTAGDTAQLTVKQAWKLDLPASLPVESKDLDCPQGFLPGVTYVFYLYRAAPDGPWSTRNCVGNKPVDQPDLPPQFPKLAREDIAWLNKRGAAAKVLR